MPYYVEFPADPVVNVHWRKKKKDEPPPDPTEDYCFGGIWSYTQSGSGSILEIHDALTMELNGVSGDRVFSSPPNMNIFRVYTSVVEFGPLGQDPVTSFPKNLYGHGLQRPGSALLIEGITSPAVPSGPPPFPPPPGSSGWIPKFTVSPSTPTLSFSSIEDLHTMPVYPDAPFMSRAGSWSYRYNMMAPSPPSYPNFNPNAYGGYGAFYLTVQGGAVSFSGEYQGWYNYYYLGIGGDPGTVGDQFYDNFSYGSTSSFALKLTQICGPV